MARAYVYAALALTLAAHPAAAQRADTPPGMPTGEHTATINGVRLWYRVAWGERAGAAPVVFLPDGPGRNSYGFDPVPSSLCTGRWTVGSTAVHGSELALSSEASTQSG